MKKLVVNDDSVPRTFINRPHPPAPWIISSRFLPTQSFRMGIIVRVEVVLPKKELIEPVFKCACGTQCASRMCSTGINKGRLFYRCGNGLVENSNNDEEDPRWNKVSIFGKFNCVNNTKSALSPLM
jgi:hypothetical protein